MKIHDRVREALLPILSAAMDIAVRHGLASDYGAGNRPRHIAGNLAEPDELRLILLLAEPGSSPGPEELNRNKAAWIDDVTCDGLGNGRFRLRYDEYAATAYEKNPHEFIEMVWPDESTPERMRKTISTNSFWMQASMSGGTIPAGAANDFGPYLRSLVSAFPNAVVAAAGSKAADRCRRASISAIEMGALTPPGSNRPKVRGTWHPTALEVQRRLDF